MADPDDPCEDPGDQFRQILFAEAHRQQDARRFMEIIEGDRLGCEVIWLGNVEGEDF